MFTHYFKDRGKRRIIIRKMNKLHHQFPQNSYLGSHYHKNPKLDENQFHTGTPDIISISFIISPLKNGNNFKLIQYNDQFYKYLNTCHKA
jgi:hypothetical protein